MLCHLVNLGLRFASHLAAEEAPPPGAAGGGQLTDGFFQPVGDGGRHRRVQRIMPQHLLHAGELLRGDDCVCCCAAASCSCSLLGKFGLAFHTRTSSGFLKQDGEGLAGAVEFASDRVGGLLGQRADLFVANCSSATSSSRSRYSRGSPSSVFWMRWPSSLVSSTRNGESVWAGVVSQMRLVGVGQHVPLMPGGLQVAAMVDRNPVKPRAPRGSPPELFILRKALRNTSWVASSAFSGSLSMRRHK